MGAINKYDMSGDCFFRGQRAEKIFESIANRKKFTCIPASSGDNIFKHVDFSLKKGKTKFLVDVKAEKKTRRSDESCNSTWIWIELQNVKGNKGWLYGDADVIAFERELDFVLVGRLKLVSFINCLNLSPSLVKKSSEAKYRLYQRVSSGRKDLITQIEMEKILEIEGIKIWEK